MAPIEEVTPESLAASAQADLVGLIWMCKRFCASMAGRGRGRGSVINIGSIYSVVGNDPNLNVETGRVPPIVYPFIKGGVVNFTRSLAAHYGKQGVRVNAISPGGLDPTCPPAFNSVYSARCPLGRMMNQEDIDWQAGRVTVTSPKTEHHEGKGSRVIPLFPELRGVLQEARAKAETNDEYVVNGYRDKAVTERGWRNCNLRTQFERLIKRAGLTPWPRLFHNLRSTRETELAAEYPIQVVTAWLGNTPRIALKHTSKSPTGTSHVLPGVPPGTP